MIIEWGDHAWDDMLYWAKNDKRVLARIMKLIEGIRKDPFSGIGKPEALKNNLSGYWSRRINSEHRLVYRIHDGKLQIIMARYHY